MQQIADNGVLSEDEDIISYIEVGLLGRWGEQHGGRWTEDTAYSTQLIDRFLAMLPGTATISSRTTHRITAWVNTKLSTSYNANNIGGMLADIAQKHSTVLNPTTGKLVKDVLARLGIYNDGYLTTNDDYGTYSNRAQETMFLNTQANTNFGGEFAKNRVLQIFDDAYTDVWWPENAIPEMYDTHLSNINSNIWEQGSKQSFKNQVSSIREANDFVTHLLHAYGIFNAQVFDGKKLNAFDTSSLNIASGGTIVGSNTDIALLYTSDKSITVKFTPLGFDNYYFDADIAAKVAAKTGLTADLSAYYGQTAYKFIRDHLGYRFVLQKSLITAGSSRPGETINIKFSIENTGFANVVKAKTAELLFVNGKVSFKTPLGADLKTWKSLSITEVSKDIVLPSNMPDGTWQVYLRISNGTDPSKAGISHIQLANQDTWDASLKANRLGAFKINAKKMPDTFASL